MNLPLRSQPANDAGQNTDTASGTEPKLAQAARFIRMHSIAAIYHAGSGHPGGAMSSAELFACLYGAEMNVRPGGIDDPSRDRFVLSKGHGAPALYATGAHFGFCDARAALALRKLGSPFQGHPHVLDLPWVETSTGSLGQGISVAVGMALGLRIQKNPARVYCLLGDGEMQEGEVWEAAMSAAHHELSRLTAVVDYNKLQSDASNDSIMRLEPLADKWRAFGWNVQEIDGHDVTAILDAFHNTGLNAELSKVPSLIIAHTIKGKGVPYMENIPAWHGSVKFTRAQAEEALTALGADAGQIAEFLDDL
ncbi:MAG: transketolase [Alphaproteobacteria bacterium]|nr:transketolase [Alphaproteobacteria bacterium]